MKSVFIFNQLNDIVFVHYDEGFRRHVLARAAEAGLTTKDRDCGHPLDPNVAMQLFSPLVASLRFMTEQVDNPYQSIRCENDFLFVMEQYHDHILLAINGDQLETEEFLHRKLLILQRILRFFFGPCDEEIRREKLPERDARWRFVSQLLDTWVDLYDTEQSFLVEAVERLHVNQLLNAKCIQLLEMVLSAVRTTGGEKGAVHALLTVNSKLLSLFSMRTAYELLPSDLLLLIILARTKFPARQRLEDFFSQSVAMSSTEALPVPVREHYQSAPEDLDPNDEAELDCFSSVPSTPTQSPERGASPVPESTPQEAFSLNTENTAAVLNKVEEALQTVAEDPRALLEMFYTPVPESEEERTSCKRHTVMIGTPLCKYTPHTVHCVEVMPGVILTILCEVSRSKVSGTICQTVSVLRAVLHKASVSSLQAKQTMDFIDANLKKILDMMKRLKTRGRKEINVDKAKSPSGKMLKQEIGLEDLTTENVINATLWQDASLHYITEGMILKIHDSKISKSDFDNQLEINVNYSDNVVGGSYIDRITDDIAKKWDTSKRSGLLAYLDSRDDTAIPSRLEATLTSVLERLKALFKVLYLTQKRLTPEAQQNLTRSIDYAQVLMRRHLYDYKEYLAVKAQRNITMTNFVEDFPGLIHFIYVDRAMHHMVAPSINMTSDPGPGKVDMMSIIKAKLWSKIPDIQSRLRNGHLTQVLRDGDFLYSYFLWFEDGSGHPVQIPNAYDGVKENMLPGILTGGFYRQLARQVFPGTPQVGALRGYELLTLHVGILPTHLVLRQGRKLAAMMWETTGEANSPITLL